MLQKQNGARDLMSKSDCLLVYFLTSHELDETFFFILSKYTLIRLSHNTNNTQATRIQYIIKSRLGVDINARLPCFTLLCFALLVMRIVTGPRVTPHMSFTHAVIFMSVISSTCTNSQKVIEKLG